MHSLFLELGIVVMAAAAVATLGYALRQPLLIGYLAAGVLIGPFGFGLVTDLETIHVIARLGIMLLLFLVGLEMDFKRLRQLGLVSVAAGVGQVLFTAAAGLALTLALGFNITPAAYLAVALTFSSTIIALKILSDKNDTSSLYGQITIGILLVQDFLAIVALLVLGGFEAGGFQPGLLGMILLKGLVLAAVALFLARTVLARLLGFVAGSHELLILLGLAWAFAVTLASEAIGFSAEIGAFIAGISLAGLPFTYEISAKAKVLRDFFITVFFVALGAGLVFASLGAYLPSLLLLSLLVIIGNPLIMLIIMGILGYDKRTSFFTGLAIANISEFSLLVLARGSALGHLSPEEIAMGTVIGILTMTASSYMMIYNEQLYRVFKPVLMLFERKRRRPHTPPPIRSGHVLLLGCSHTGEQVLEQLHGMHMDYLVLDHDIAVVRTLAARGIPCVFGDVEDEDVMAEIGLAHADLVISTVANHEDSLALLRQVRALSADSRPRTILTADSGREGLELFNLGADYVILRPYLGAAQIRQVHRELYGLEEQPRMTAPTAHELVHTEPRTDIEYAHLLHRLNALRLEELKRMTRSRS